MIIQTLPKGHAYVLRSVHGQRFNNIMGTAKVEFEGDKVIIYPDNGLELIQGQYYLIVNTETVTKRKVDISIRVDSPKRQKTKLKAIVDEATGKVLTLIGMNVKPRKYIGKIGRNNVPASVIGNGK